MGPFCQRVLASVLFTDDETFILQIEKMVSCLISVLKLILTYSLNIFTVTASQVELLYTPSYHVQAFPNFPEVGAAITPASPFSNPKLALLALTLPSMRPPQLLSTQV